MKPKTDWVNVLAGIGAVFLFVFFFAFPPIFYDFNRPSGKGYEFIQKQIFRKDKAVILYLDGDTIRRADGSVVRSPNLEYMVKEIKAFESQEAFLKRIQ